MAYNNLDWIVAWYVDDYVTLTNNQEKELDETIKSFISWHRQSELQDYILQIKYIKIDIKNGIKSSNIRDYRNVLKQFLDSALIQFEPDITRFAYALTDQQVEEFLTEVEQRNLERIKKIKKQGEKKRLKNNLEKTESRIESFIGDLNLVQKQLLKETNQTLLSTFEYSIELRRTWADSIRHAYKIRNEIVPFEGQDSGSCKLAFREALRPSILEISTLRSEAHLAALAHNQLIWEKAMEQLMISLSEKQLKALNNKLNETIEDLEALI